MARSMFPFDDSYRVTFNGFLLPSQNGDGEIVSPTMPDPRYKLFPLDEAPPVPLWRMKTASVSSSTTTTTSPTNSPIECVKKKDAETMVSTSTCEREEKSPCISTTQCVPGATTVDETTK